MNESLKIYISCNSPVARTIIERSRQIFSCSFLLFLDNNHVVLEGILNVASQYAMINSLASIFIAFYYNMFYQIFLLCSTLG